RRPSPRTAAIPRPNTLRAPASSPAAVSTCRRPLFLTPPRPSIVLRWAARRAEPHAAPVVRMRGVQPPRAKRSHFPSSTLFAPSLRVLLFLFCSSLCYGSSWLSRPASAHPSRLSRWLVAARLPPPDRPGTPQPGRSFSASGQDIVHRQ